jgi:photosystem II stability/assembly factor-like uncharacterized protein
MELWRDGKLASQSTEWSGGSGLPVLDSRRGRVYYETIAGDLLRVFDAGTLRLLAVLPQSLPGQIVGFDPGTDQLYFLTLGRLQPLPAASLSLPAPQQPAPAASPPSPAALLAVSPGYAADKTMFAVWGSEMTREGCYVFGQVGGTLLRSSDGGQSWRRPQAGLPGDCAAYTSALAVSPAYPQDHTVFAGIAGSGLFKSTDGGALWAPASGPASSMVVRQILLSPAYGRDQTAFVVEETTMERSTDGGATWTRSGDLSARVAALSPEFDQDGTLVAWGYAAGSQTGLKISRDRGQRWEDLSDPIRAPGSATVVGLSLAPAFDRWQVMFAVDSRGNVHRSSDGGKSWQVVANTDLTDAVGAQIAYGSSETNRPVFMLITRRDNSVQAPSLTGRLFRSGDGGQTWQRVNPGVDIDPTALALSPEFAQDGLLLLGSTGTVVAVKAMDLAVQP